LLDVQDNNYITFVALCIVIIISILAFLHQICYSSDKKEMKKEMVIWNVKYTIFLTMNKM